MPRCAWWHHLRLPSRCCLTANGHADEVFTPYSIFDGHAQVPTRGLVATRRWALGCVFVYQLALLYRYEHGLDLNVGLKAFLKAA
jgi:hypothetical protein